MRPYDNFQFRKERKQESEHENLPIDVRVVL